MTNEKIEKCLKQMTEILNEHNLEIFPQIIITDKGVFANINLRNRVQAGQTGLQDYKGEK